MQPGRATRSRKRRRGKEEHKRAPTKLPTNDLQASAHGCQAVKVCDVKVLPALQRLVSWLADRCLHGRACLWLQLDNRKPIDLWRQTRSLRRCRHFRESSPLLDPFRIQCSEREDRRRSRNVLSPASEAAWNQSRVYVQLNDR